MSLESTLKIEVEFRSPVNSIRVLMIRRGLLEHLNLSGVVIFLVKTKSPVVSRRRDVVSPGLAPLNLYDDVSFAFTSPLINANPRISTLSRSKTVVEVPPRSTKISHCREVVGDGDDTIKLSKINVNVNRSFAGAMANDPVGQPEPLAVVWGRFADAGQPSLENIPIGVDGDLSPSSTLFKHFFSNSSLLTCFP